ncbi:MAG: hypothetical protein Q9211_005668 [Gyalolechia sp. 1 TL-2023]
MAWVDLRKVLCLYAAALVGTVAAFPEISRRHKADAMLRERGVCYDDDTLLSLRYWIVDSEPYCSSLLKVEDVTSILPPATLRTTTTTVVEDVTTLHATLTVPQITTLETITATIGQILKREPAATTTSVVDVEPQPYPYNYVSSLALDAAH